MIEADGDWRRALRGAAHRIATILALAGALVPGAAPELGAQQTPPDSADVATIDGIIAATYDVISGPAGERDWDRERSLFHPGSRHMPTQANAVGGSSVNVTTVDGFIEASRGLFAGSGFYEYEIARTT